MAKPKEQRKADEGAAKYKARFAKNANYDGNQDEPTNRMGTGSFANLPSEPMYAEFVEPTYRDGIVPSFTAQVSDLSGIDENRRK